MKVYDIDSLPLMKVCKDENGKYFVTGGVTYNYKPKIKEKFRKDTRYNTVNNPKLFRTWHDMNTRCYNSNRHNYKWYGARGIKICDEWREGSYSFIKWALSNGYKEGLEIDRIDNNGNYEPNNCRWITHKENLMNRSISKITKNKCAS